MKPLRPLFALLVALLASTAFAADVKPIGEIDAVVPQGIKLLETKDYKTFLQLFVPPGEVQNIEKEGGLEVFAQKWGDGKAPRLLAVLQAVKDTKPEMSEDGKKATYRLNAPVHGKNVISFTKIGEGWYLVN